MRVSRRAAGGPARARLRSKRVRHNWARCELALVAVATPLHSVIVFPHSLHVKASSDRLPYTVYRLPFTFFRHALLKNSAREPLS